MTEWQCNNMFILNIKSCSNTIMWFTLFNQEEKLKVISMLNVFLFSENLYSMPSPNLLYVIYSLLHTTKIGLLRKVNGPAKRMDFLCITSPIEVPMLKKINVVLTDHGQIQVLSWTDHVILVKVEPLDFGLKQYGMSIAAHKSDHDRSVQHWFFESLDRK